MIREAEERHGATPPQMTELEGALLLAVEKATGVTLESWEKRQLAFLEATRQYLPLEWRQRLFNLIYPDGLPEMFRCHAGNAGEEAVLREVFAAPVLITVLGPGGGGMPELRRRLEAAKAKHLPTAGGDSNAR